MSTVTRKIIPETKRAYRELVGKGQWEIHGDADYWKEFEHTRWMTPRDRPGCMFLFGEPSETPGRDSADEKSHGEYAAGICAEIQVEADVKGEWVRKWINKGKQNDYLDASYMTCVAAAMKGIRVVGTQPAGRPKPQDRPSARDLANRGRKSA